MENQSFAIYHDLHIMASPAKIFRGISEPDQLINWWPKACTGCPAEGAEYNFFFTPEYNWYGEVLRIVPDKSFHIKMTRADRDWNPTSFGFDLIETDQGVQLRFEHVGWPECNAHFRRSSFCWAMLLNGLKNYVEQGTIVPFEERE